MKIAVTGASGLIGSALVPHLRSVGHDVVRLVRRPSSAPDEVTWDPAVGTVDLDALAGTEAVVHLAGAGVGDHRWTDDYKRTILDSRVDGTHTIARAMAQLDPRPRVLVSASAIGWYGDTGATAVDETASPGTGFLANVVRAWEAAATPAAEAGIRVVHPRTGLVVEAPNSTMGPLLSVLKLAAGGSTSGIGGAFGPLVPAVRLNLAGRFGSGRQYWSWISLRDEVCAIQFLLEQEGLSGPVNLTGPAPVTNAEVTSALAEQIGRRWLPPIPAFAVRTLLGEFSTEILGSTRVIPTVLTNAGFVFQDPTIESAIRTALADT
jgi:NAD dependent epimerase/dehydratase family enzyme